LSFAFKILGHCFGFIFETHNVSPELVVVFSTLTHL
jgi:hypothetical protein